MPPVPPFGDDETTYRGNTTLMSGKRLLRRGVPGILAALALAAMPAAASADGLNIGLNGCPDATVEHPFARWLDNGNYVLAPGGTFEGSMDGWKLSGGAKVVAGGEPFDVNGDSRYSLSLPSGSSATTPPICVAVLDPTMRYFGANDGGLLSLMNVQVIYHMPGGGTLTLPLGVGLGGKSWAPSLPVVVGADLLGALDGGQATVQFRFVPTGLGAKWRIDDVYVDPFMTR
jgi:hypothetical protein